VTRVRGGGGEGGVEVERVGWRWRGGGGGGGGGGGVGWGGGVVDLGIKGLGGGAKRKDFGFVCWHDLEIVATYSESCNELVTRQELLMS